ncbi:LysR family transcriptional regulator [Amorphus sp. 3PC139-8]|uniref:LysR family transcriptional regulator n=1 Tax=Amorphus sp. 3PC139-8 TaxID=2735676 RepID=UPI00345DA9E1
MKAINAVNLRHLRAFNMICETGSISLAADHMNMSQPGISQAVAKLEKRFSARLLTRRTAGSFPTPEGEILYRRAARLFRQLREAVLAVGGRSLIRQPDAIDPILKRMTAVQLRALRLLSRYGTLREAAQAESISLSTLHRAAHDLESNIGVTLYLRGAAGFTLSEQGRELARRCQVALNEIFQAEEEIVDHTRSTGGRVAVATLPLVRTAFLAQAISYAKAERPDLEFKILDGAYEAMLAALTRGDCDMLFGALRGPAPSPHVIERKLFDNPYAIVGRADHPLNRADVTRQELARMDWVIPRHGTPIRDAFEQIFASIDVTPKVDIEASSMVLIRSLLLDSDRLTLLSRRQIAVDERAGLLGVIPYPLPETSRPIGITTRADWLPSPGQRSFLGAVERALKQLDTM